MRDEEDRETLVLLKAADELVQPLLAGLVDARRRLMAATWVRLLTWRGYTCLMAQTGADVIARMDTERGG